VTTPFFDDSLPRLAETIVETLGANALDNGVVLRDAAGRLAFVHDGDSSSVTNPQAIESAVREGLGAYARFGRALLFRDDPGADILLDEESHLRVLVGETYCNLVDRRIVGSGWLESPPKIEPAIPRIVFASLKGGVGRSTAVAVAAADLAQRNKNVLVVDLDLEAPGIGPLLLDEERMPKYGAIDFLIENGIRNIETDVLADFIGTSSLTTGAGGRVDVVPALGSVSLGAPQNILPKLARAMIEDVSDEGISTSVGNKIEKMISALSAQNSYDVVFIDSRAGLAELTAPAVLGLGATVLLFGTAQRQTIEGYQALFAGLNLLAQRDRDEGDLAEWRLMFKAVYAKASLENEVASDFRDELFDLFAGTIYDVESEETEQPITFDIDDSDAPHWPLVIPFSQGFVDFDPVATPNQLTRAFYEQTYRSFIDGLDLIIAQWGKVTEDDQ
jgi:MinD-like ATPase involved in chromosome partitioning or flagellar assembly